MKSLTQKGLFLALAWLLATLVAGCATPPVATGNQAAPAASQQRYLIGPGDSLEIFVRDNPKLTTTVPVRPDGRISIPLVQSIMAAGKTPDQLSEDLQKKLAQYIRSPLVTVIVKSFVGAFSQQVRVVGQATTAKAVPYRRGMTVLDVMIAAGGLTKFAAGNKARIIRHGADGKQQSIPVRLSDLMNGEVKYNMAMHPGDILIIPRSFL